MSHRLIIKDAVWQLIGRILSALAGLLVVKMISPYLGPYRFGDYKTVLDYFAIWGALADFGLYVLALRTLGAIKEGKQDQAVKRDALEDYYGKFVFSRFVSIAVVYVIAIVLAYLIPSYTANPYLTWGLPLGMMFSASFMAAGIVQLPLQLFWKMEQVSVALVGARFVQIVFLALLMYWWYPSSSFGDNVPLRVFLSVMFSVFISGVFQGLFVRYKSQPFLRLRFVPDWGYTRSVFRDNWQYGCAYFLSSFHTLFVSILFSVYYPTIDGYSYVGMWSLALVFITILIIIPATLGNSMIHKIADSSYEKKSFVLGNFLILMVWVGLCVVIGSTAFADQIVYFVGGTDYLGTSFSSPGSNVLLPWLSLILLGSFIKQTYNYNFIAHHKQHLLFWINLLGVVIGVPVGIFLVKHYSLVGGLVAQGLLELLFVSGAIYFAWKHRIVPCVSWNLLIPLVTLGGLFLYLSYVGHSYLSYDSIGGTILVFVSLFVPFFALSYRFVRKVARGLSP